MLHISSAEQRLLVYHPNTQRYTISNVESQVFTPNNVPGPRSESRPPA